MPCLVSLPLRLQIKIELQYQVELGWLFSHSSAGVHANNETKTKTKTQTHRVKFLRGAKIQNLFSVLTDNSFHETNNTHLGLKRRERMKQVEMLLGTKWLANVLCREPVILEAILMPFLLQRCEKN